jgi:predicted ATPase/DNA-binding winged helix-turn-helix (wHTH) protein/tetratricopeptide (TPR) repeat protein
MAMSSPQEPLSVMQFQGWELRPGDRLLLVRGQVADVGPRALDVLLALARRPGALVTKDQLMAEAWAGLVVEENNISVQINALRKALGHAAIATVRGSGYVLRSAGAAAREVSEDLKKEVQPPALHLKPARRAAHLLGRGADKQALAPRIGAAALLSIVGPGGVGKTSLARSLLDGHEGNWPGGVHWIELAPEPDASRLVERIGKVLGVDLSRTERAREDLLAAMVPMEALLVVDNCEHVRAELAAFVRLAMEHAPGVRWLATSQRPLRVAGEMLYRLEPLEVPASEATLEEAEACAAVALLCRCVREADHRFVLDASNLRLAIDLCHQLDGLPLAIEMAAARVATLGLAVVHERLGQHLRLLAGPRDGHMRQRTLQSAFDWSYGLLSTSEQHVFERLQPFLGGFTAALAQAVMAEVVEGEPALDEDQVLDALSALVDQSLVQRGPGRSERFHLLESARAYARERLVQTGRMAAAQRCHAHAVAAMFAGARSDAEHLRDEQWVQRYTPERFNVRAALAWACASPEEAEPELLARLVSAMAQVDSFLGGRAEVVHAPIPIVRLLEAPAKARAEACLFMSWAHYMDGNRETGALIAQRAADDFQRLGDTAGTFRALAQLIRLYESRPGMLEPARRAAEQLQDIDQRQLPPRTRLFCSITAGFQYQTRGGALGPEALEDLARRAGFAGLAATCRAHIVDELLIEGRFEEAVVLARRYLDDPPIRPRTRGRILMNQTLALVRLARVDEAFETAREALRIHPSDAPRVVDLLALAAVRQGRYPEAAQMAGFGAQSRHVNDEAPDPAEAAVIEQTVADLAAALPPARLAELMRMGAEMPLVEVLAIALPGAPPRDPGSPRGASASGAPDQGS